MQPFIRTDLSSDTAETAIAGLPGAMAAKSSSAENRPFATKISTYVSGSRDAWHWRARAAKERHDRSAAANSQSQPAVLDPLQSFGR